MASPRVPDSHSPQSERHEENNFDNIQRCLPSLHPAPGQWSALHEEILIDIQHHNSIEIDS